MVVVFDNIQYRIPASYVLSYQGPVKLVTAASHASLNPRNLPVSLICEVSERYIILGVVYSNVRQVIATLIPSFHVDVQGDSGMHSTRTRTCMHTYSYLVPGMHTSTMKRVLILDGKHDVLCTVVQDTVVEYVYAEKTITTGIIVVRGTRLSVIFYERSIVGIHAVCCVSLVQARVEDSMFNDKQLR